MKTNGWFDKPRSTWPLLMLFVLLAISLVVLQENWDDIEQLWSPEKFLQPDPASVSTNRLAIGSASIIKGPLSPLIIAPMKLDGLSRQQIMALRSKAITRHASIVQGTYHPEPIVFDQIENGRPWWGLAGRFFFGRGERSIEGLSIQSVSILNPFLLIGADFWHDGDMRWDDAQVTPDIAMAPNFPYLPRISSLTIWPDKARGEAVYEFSHFLETQSPLLDPETPWKQTRVDLTAYNARDLGFAYLYVSLDESENIDRNGNWRTAALIPQFLHTGGSCGYPGGCNNLSPRFPAAEELKVTNLPATIAVRLWRDKPASVESPPDMLFLVKLK